MADYKCEKCGMSVIVVDNTVIRPCKEDCKETIVANISATVFAVGGLNNAENKRHS